MYLSGLSGTTADNFNSTKYPGTCKPIDAATLAFVMDFQRQLNRVAQKLNFPKIAPDGSIGPATLALFRLVQAASNQPQYAGGGSSTLDLTTASNPYGTVSATISGGTSIDNTNPLLATNPISVFGDDSTLAIMGDASSCILVASDVDIIAGQVKAFADAIGAPATVSSPTAGAGFGPGKASTVSPKGTETPRGTGASIMDSFNNLSTIEKVAVAGAVGAIGFVLYDMHGKGGKRRRSGARR